MFPVHVLERSEEFFKGGRFQTQQMFLRDPKRSLQVILGNAESCRSSVLFGSKGSSVAESKIFFDLFGNYPAFACPPPAAPTLPLQPPAPNLQNSGHKQQLSSSWVACAKPRRRWNTHHLPFLPDFLSHDFLHIH